MNALFCRGVAGRRLPLVETSRRRSTWPGVCIVVVAVDVAAASAHDEIPAGASGLLREEDAEKGERDAAIALADAFNSEARS